MQEGSLILLPCHSIWKNDTGEGFHAREWYLASFQKDGQDHLCFREHILRSLDLLRSHSNATLIISGGQTKEEAGPISEAHSYYQLTKLLSGSDWDSLNPRIFLEEYARDSFENVLFLFCRYYEIKGFYPTFVHVVGFEFKRERFLHYHLGQAMQYPVESVRYVGNSPNPASESQRNKYFAELIASEQKHALVPFKKDYYGSQFPLATKREARNPFRRTNGYSMSNPHLVRVLAITAGKESFDESVAEQLRSLWSVPRGK